MDVWEWSGGPAGFLGVVGRPSQMTGSGRRLSRISGIYREAHPDVREWSGGPTGCPVVVERHSRMSESCQRPSRMSGIGRETIRNVWE